MQFAIFAILSVAIFIPNMIDLGYWPTDMETLVYTLGSLVIASILTLVSKLHASVGRFLIAILLYWIIDEYFTVTALIPILVGITTCILLHTRLERSLRPMVLVFGFVFVVSSLFHVRPLLTQDVAPGAQAIAQKSVSAGPAIIHIVLDEFMSLDAAVRIGMLDKGLAEKVNADYVSRGFRVYSATRSVADATRISLSNLLGLGDPTQPADYNVEQLRRNGAKYFIIKENRWVDHLKSLGYHITTIGTDHFDICSRGVDECYVYRNNGEGHFMNQFTGAFLQRMVFPLLVMDFHFYNRRHVGDVALYRLVSKKLRKAGFKIVPRGFQTRPGSALAVVDELKSRFKNIGPGQAFFVHILMPHYPHILDENCNLKPLGEWTLIDYDKEEASDVERYASFAKQMSCTHKRTIAVIDTVLSSAGGKNAIIFIHGDHGLRIMNKEGNVRPDSNLPPEIISDALDPMFTVKATNVLEPGVDSTPGIMQSIFRDIFLKVVK